MAVRDHSWIMYNPVEERLRTRIFRPAPTGQRFVFWEFPGLSTQDENPALFENGDDGPKSPVQIREIGVIGWFIQNSRLARDSPTRD
jgi:hypothetical protein